MIELIVVFILGLIASVIANDVGANAGSICYWLVRLAACQAPKTKRTRLEEEWMADIDETPGTFPKLFVISGFFVTSLKLRVKSASVHEMHNKAEKKSAREEELSIDGSNDDRYSGLQFNPSLFMTINDLMLGERARNSLTQDNIVYIGDLIQKTEGELIRLPNFGRRSLNEIREGLATIGLHLGMEVSAWPPENIEQLAHDLKDWRKLG